VQEARHRASYQQAEVPLAVGAGVRLKGDEAKAIANPMAGAEVGNQALAVFGLGADSLTGPVLRVPLEGGPRGEKRVEPFVVAAVEGGDEGFQRFAGRGLSACLSRDGSRVVA
jgi:hypothetical protein